MKITCFLVPVLPPVMSILVTGFYLKHFADMVAKYTGYFFTLAVLPFVIGVVIGFAVMAFLGRSSKSFSNKTSFVYVPIGAGLAAYVPIIYLLIVMNLYH